jgi:ATP-dependent protease HslVU (ClpYQ) peptidase subunit
VTVLAWDGRNLAADKQSTADNLRRTVTKIHVVPEGIVGFCGSTVAAAALLQWFRGGRRQGEYPDIQRSDKDAYALFIDWTGQSWSYEDHPYPIKNEDDLSAMGSGRDFAITALHLGHNAMKAVEVACQLTNCCGMGMDVLNLSEEFRKHREARHEAVEQGA